MSDDTPQNEVENVISEDVAEEASTESEAPAGADVTEASAPLTINDLKTGMAFDGKVKSIDLYGAFVDIGVGKDGLLHISQLGKSNVRNVEDVLKPGEIVTVYVLKVDAPNQRIALSTQKPPENPISTIRQGDIVTGKVVRIETFGAFVDIGAERPGMIHVSELAKDFIQSPEDVVQIDQEIQAKVIKINKKKKQIDLSIKALEEDQSPAETSSAAATAQADDEPMPTAMELALRRAMQDSDGDESDKAKNAKKSAGTKNKRALNDALMRTLKQQGN